MKNIKALIPAVTLFAGGPVIMVILSLAILASGCGQRSVTAPEPDANLAENRASLASGISSSPARRIAQLIDQKAFDAADGLLMKLLREHPEDAGLHVQYARCLILATDIATPGNVITPYYTDNNRYWASSVANEAIKRAVQLAPASKPHIAEVILQALHEKATETLQAGRGLIATPMEFVHYQQDRTSIQHGFAVSMMQVAWGGLGASPKTASQFVSKYCELREKAVRLGKVASAAMLGNLVGDMEQGGVNGELDFERACDAFSRSLEYYHATDDFDWIALTIDIMVDIYRTGELDKARTGKAPQSFIILENHLKEYGKSLLGVPNGKYGLHPTTTGAVPEE